MLLFSTNGIEAQEKDISSQITLANESYHEKDYETAAGIFENLIAKAKSMDTYITTLATPT